MNIPLSRCDSEYQFIHNNSEDDFSLPRDWCHENLLHMWSFLTGSNQMIGIDLKINPIILNKTTLDFYLKTIEILKGNLIFVTESLTVTKEPLKARYLYVNPKEYKNPAAFYVFWNLIRYIVRMVIPEENAIYMEDEYNEIPEILLKIKKKYPRWQSIKCLQLAHIKYDLPAEHYNRIRELLRSYLKEHIYKNIKFPIDENLKELYVSSSFSMIGYDSFVRCGERTITKTKIADMAYFEKRCTEPSLEVFPSKFMKTENRELKKDEIIELIKLIDAIENKQFLKIKHFFDNDF